MGTHIITRLHKDKYRRLSELLIYKYKHTFVGFCMCWGEVCCITVVCSFCCGYVCFFLSFFLVRSFMLLRGYVRKGITTSRPVLYLKSFERSLPRPSILAKTILSISVISIVISIIIISIFTLIFLFNLIFDHISISFLSSSSSSSSSSSL